MRLRLAVVVLSFFMLASPAFAETSVLSSLFGGGNKSTATTAKSSDSADTARDRSNAEELKDLQERKVQIDKRRAGMRAQMKAIQEQGDEAAKTQRVHGGNASSNKFGKTDSTPASTTTTPTVAPTATTTVAPTITKQ